MLPIGALVFWAIRLLNYFDSEMFTFDVALVALNGEKYFDYIFVCRCRFCATGLPVRVVVGKDWK